MPSTRDRRTVLYRFYGARDVLLYVGATGNPGERWTDHLQKKSWWHKVRRQTAEWFVSREAAEEAERAAIETEQPLYNVVYSSRSPEPLTAAELRLLLYDLDAVMGTERVRLAELPARLRFLAPGIPMYQKLNGVRLQIALGSAGVRTTTAGNVPRLDPADLRRARDQPAA
jgi:hypothetical protein